MNTNAKNFLFLASIVGIPAYILFFFPMIYNATMISESVNALVAKYILLVFARVVVVVYIFIIIVMWGKLFDNKKTIVALLISVIAIIVYVILNQLIIHDVLKREVFSPNAYYLHNHFTASILIGLLYSSLLFYSSYSYFGRL